jgi:aryl-alcohol dehydrogenase-like predicted oxidoreductase
MLTEEKFDALERLETFVAERGHTILELAFAWLLARPSVSSVIAGASRPEQVASNAETAGWRLTAEDMAEIDSLLAGG